MDAAVVMRYRMALLASCVAFPAVAQEVPAIQNQPVEASASAEIQASQQLAVARAQAAARVKADMALRDQAVGQANAQMPVNQQAANGQGTVPRTMPPPIDPVAPDKPLPAKASANLTVARRWINKYQKPILDEDGVEHFVEGKGQVFVVAAVNHATDIMMAPGERVTDKPIFGDITGWRSLPTSSGMGRKTQSHIIIKPADAGLSTNVVIVTNLRSISIELVSRRSDYMPKVALDVPEDNSVGWDRYLGKGGNQTAAVATIDPCDQAPTIAPDQFKPSGDTEATWRPVQVYAVATAVGMKTCVEFPSSIGSEDLPGILALADDGGWFKSPSKKIINVRYVKRRYVADEMLNRFILVDGVGSEQKSITYTRKGM